MNDLQKAQTILEQSGYTCVLCSGEQVKTDSRRGVKPLLELLESGENYNGFCAADKVVGKAAAHLYCLLGVKAVYAGVISQRAKAVLEENGTPVTFGTEVSAIRNRTNTGLCPMESAVWDITDHESAHRAILTTLQKLQSA
jgi:hypothetical protein